MAVRVIETYETDPITYSRGRKWHVDDRGMLHVVGENGNEATYAPNCWVAAQIV